MILKDYLELFDCQVIGDIGQHPVTKKNCALYAIGCNDEPAAGLWGFCLTPYFYSLEQLKKYCKSQKGKMEIGKKAMEIFPDFDLNKFDFTFNS